MTNLLTSMLQSPMITRLGWTLLHSLWQIILLGIVFGIAVSMMRKSDARWRYTSCFVALLACTLLPLVTFALTDSSSQPPPRPLAASRAPHPIPRPHTMVPSILQPILPTFSPPISTPPRSAQPFSATGHIPSTSTVLPWIVLTWAVGVIALSLWNLGGWLALRHLRSRRTHPAPSHVINAAARLAHRLNLHRPVQILQSALATTPLVLGALRPVILLPASVLTELSTAELESILAHELAHVRRHDYLINLLQSVIETLLFYHPVVWWISRRMRAERELCCDDLALAVTLNRVTYATALAAVASVRVPVLAPAASGGRLLPRLRRVLGVPEADSARSSRGLAGAIVAVCVAVAIVAPHLQSKVKAADKAAAPDNDVVVVHGRVLDPTGKPAAGAKVTAAPAWPKSFDDRPAVISSTTAGPDGGFQLAFKKSQASAFSTGFGWSAADLWKKTQIVATADGLGLDWQQFDRADAAGDLVLRLVPDVPLQGRIVDLEGRPLAGVAVTVAGMASHILTDSSQLKSPPENYRGIGLPLAAIENNTAIVTDADGRFRITGLGRERRVELEFRHDNFAMPREYVITREGPPVAVSWGSGDRAAQMKYYGSAFELAAPPARIVSGIVRDARTHEPIANARVETDYSRVQAKTLTDAEGRYRLGGLERGHTTQLKIFTDDRPYIPSIVTLADPPGLQAIITDVELFKGIWITGRVTDQQTQTGVPINVNYLPLASNQFAAKVPVFRLGFAQPPCNADTKPDGTYRLIAAPGPGIVAVRGPSVTYSLGQGFDVIKSKDRNGNVATLLPRMVNPTWYIAAKEIDAAPDVVAEGVDFALDPGGTVHITCTDPDGKPVEKIQVQGDKPGNSRAQYTSYDSAQFDATGFTRDETRLVVVRDRDHHLAKIATVRLADATGGKLKIQLQPAGYVTGRVLTTQHDPIKGGMLEVGTYIPELKQGNRMSIEVLRAESDGRFKLELPPGTRYVLGASPSPYGGRFKSVTEDLKVASGQTKDLGDIELAEDMLK